MGFLLALPTLILWKLQHRLVQRIAKRQRPR